MKDDPERDDDGWTELLPAAEGSAPPWPSPRPRLEQLHGRPADVTDRARTGEGFDLRLRETRRWTSELPSALAVEEVLLERSWEGRDLAVLAETARQILADHQFPLDQGSVEWAWHGDRLCWRATDVGVAEDVANWLQLLASPAFAKLWPPRSAPAWASTVTSFLSTMGVIDADGAIARPPRAGLAAFDLGAFLAQESMRQLYADHVREREAQREKKQTNQAATTEKKIAWKEPARRRAEELRSERRSLTREQLTELLKDDRSLAIPVGYGTLLKAVAEWDRDGVIPARETPVR